MEKRKNNYRYSCNNFKKISVRVGVADSITKYGPNSYTSLVQILLYFTCILCVSIKTKLVNFNYLNISFITIIFIYFEVFEPFK